MFTFGVAPRDGNASSSSFLLATMAVKFHWTKWDFIQGLCILSCLLMFLVQLAPVFKQYLAGDTTTSLSHEPHQVLDLPSFTICPKVCSILCKVPLSFP